MRYEIFRVIPYGGRCLSGQLAVDVIFNFSRYEELRQAVLQLVRENLDPELLYEEAEELFESWWASNASGGHWNDDIKRRIWSSIWSEFGARPSQA